MRGGLRDIVMVSSLSVRAARAWARCSGDVGAVLGAERTRSRSGSGSLRSGSPRCVSLTGDVEADVEAYAACGACDSQGTVLGRARKGKARPARRCERCGGRGVAPGPAPEARRTAAPAVAIAGGGIGGLALALALQQRGVECRVYERDASAGARAAGYGLTVQQGGRALDALGALDAALKAGARTTRHVSVAAATGDVLGVHGEDAGKRDGAARRGATHLPRAALRRVLLERLAPGTIAWGAALSGAVAAEGGGGGYDLSFADGATARCKVLVGADGIRSKTRQLVVQGDDPHRDLGVSVILGFAPDAGAPSGRGDCFECVDGIARAYTMPYDGSRTMWQLSFRHDHAVGPLEAGMAPAALKDVAAAVVAGWAGCPAIADLVASTAAADVTGYPLTDRLPPVDRPAGAVALLGDAAHPMAPFKAQGANQALLDAVALARRLYRVEGIRPPGLPPPPGGFRALTDALDAYWAEAAPRAARKVDASRRAASLLHGPAALAISENLTRGAAAAKADAAAPP